MLDDPERVREGDPGKMLGTLSSLPEQLEEGWDRAGARIEALEVPPRVHVVGMGGSAIVGDLAAAVAAAYGGPEIRVHRSPLLPAACRPPDLLVAVSYSGNTWETLRAYQEGLRRNLPSLTVGSGGEVEEVSAARRIPHVPVPPNLPPRAALGYLIAPLLAVVARAVPAVARDLPTAAEGLGKARAAWLPAVPTASNPAKELARTVHGRTPVIYGPTPVAGVARRWQTQFNENAKVLAFHGVLPEMAHNELVGWMEDADPARFLPLFLDQPEGDPWTPFREGLLELMADRGAVTVRPRQEGFLAGLLELVLLGDLVSVYLALLRRVDPRPVPPITMLKEKLAARGLGGPGSAEGGT